MFTPESAVGEGSREIEGQRGRKRERTRDRGKSRRGEKKRQKERQRQKEADTEKQRQRGKETKAEKEKEREKEAQIRSKMADGVCFSWDICLSRCIAEGMRMAQQSFSARVCSWAKSQQVTVRRAAWLLGYWVVLPGYWVGLNV